MKENKKKYLSIRAGILVLGCVILLLTVTLFSLYYAVREGSPVWPQVIGIVGLFILFNYLIFFIVKPYVQIEKRIGLFLEGYTLPNEKKQECQLTPAGEQLILRVQEIMSSSQILSINKRQAQYLALQNQINPHFLYNTLESIRSEALIAGLDSVADMTEALATFFRYTISKVENLVSVEEELQNCETYFHIQQYRFGDRLHLSVECDDVEREDIYRCRIPKLTMQPILENSIIHGTECKIGAGHLTIHLERTKSRLLIRISDDGVGMDEETLQKMNDRIAKSGRTLAGEEDENREKGGIALVNVNNRIHLLFGEEYGLHVYSMQGVGTDVEISLPAITSDREIKNSNSR